jgi:hypothetical protein
MRVRLASSTAFWGSRHTARLEHVRSTRAPQCSRKGTEAHSDTQEVPLGNVLDAATGQQRAKPKSNDKQQRNAEQSAQHGAV